MRVEATKFDNDNRDNAGMNFSERWLADGNGTWCHGTISRVYVKRRGAPQKYSIKYDIGGTMACEEQHIENAGLEESDSEDESKNDEGEEVDSDVENADNDEDNETDHEEDEGGRVMEEDQDKIQTDESEGEGEETADRPWMAAEITEYNEQMGAVDRHNFYRQGILRLHMAWKTKSWQTRIQLEILALTLVDSFLACTKLLPQ